MNGSATSSAPETCDPALIAEYARLAAKENFRGLSVLQHEGRIAQLVRDTGARTLLDYGSGHGDAWHVHRLHERWGVATPVQYEPSIATWAEKPVGRFDGVICSDVLEHVGEEHLDAVIAELAAYATRFCFASVCCRPAKKNFSNGRNMHVTVRPQDWWIGKLGRAFGGTGIKLKLVFTP